MSEDWRVFTSRQVLERWETRGSYSAEALVAYWDWVVARTHGGPPDDALRVHGDDELFVAGVPGTTLIVAFLVVVQDRAIVVKDIA